MNSENKTDFRYSIGIFQYKFRKETPADRLERLDQEIKKIDKKIDLIICPELFMSGYGNPEDIKKIAKELSKARRPLLLVGHGAVLSKADKEITDNFYINGSPIENSQSILSDDILNYSYRLLESTINKSDIIDKHISAKLKNWDLKRIALIDKLILRLSLTEMFFFEEIPNKVSIVEGVEIAKIYGNNDSSAFINGVLDSLYNDLENNKVKI